MGLVSRIRSSGHRMLWRTASNFHWAFGQVRARLPNIRSKHEGERFHNDSKKHVVFIHFDMVGQVHDYVIKMLESLLECGFEITFVSNSPKLPEETISLLKPYTRLIIHRYNSGYDFAGYRDGIRHIPDLQNTEALVLINDSVYGPLHSLKEVLDKVSPDDVDVWGITDSWEYNYHLQAYFMLFHNKAIVSKAFTKFWKHFPNVSSKRWVITNAEVALTKKLAQEKLRIGVQCAYWDVAAGFVKPLRNSISQHTSKTPVFAEVHHNFLTSLEDNVTRGRPMNQSHIFWEATIRDWKCLFIKRELIQKNPLGVPYVWQWRKVVEECSDYDCDLIEHHLRSL